MQIAKLATSKGKTKSYNRPIRQFLKEQRLIRDRRSSKTIQKEIESLKLQQKKKDGYNIGVHCKFYEEEMEVKYKSTQSTGNQSLQSSTRSFDGKNDKYDDDSILQVLEDYQSSESSWLSQQVLNPWEAPFQGLQIVSRKIKIKDYLQYLSGQQQSQHK